MPTSRREHWLPPAERNNETTGSRWVAGRRYRALVRVRELCRGHEINGVADVRTRFRRHAVFTAQADHARQCSEIAARVGLSHEAAGCAIGGKFKHAARG